VLTAAGFEALAGMRLARVRVGRVMGALVILALGLVILGEGLHFVAVNPLPVLAGSQSEADYLAVNLGWYEPAIQTLNELPPEAEILFLWEPRAYYCQAVCLPDTLIDRWYSVRRTLGSSQAILSDWMQSGVTHILFYQEGMKFVQATDGRYTQSDWEALADLLAELTTVAEFGDGYILYKVPR